IFASLAALMFNCVRKEDIDYSPYDEGEWSVTALSYHHPGNSPCLIMDRHCVDSDCGDVPFDSDQGGLIKFTLLANEYIVFMGWSRMVYRLKLWLFLAYVVSFVSLAASVGLLIQDALVSSGPSTWTGVAGVLQCVFVLISY
uniref:Uncharacterized protein n=1 Tax=Chenopodium quinoa TaxID=63459 RepID=A0A803L084_CHEQI